MTFAIGTSDVLAIGGYLYFSGLVCFITEARRGAGYGTGTWRGRFFGFFRGD